MTRPDAASHIRSPIVILSHGIIMSSNIRVSRICQHCGNEFIAKTTVTQYCGDQCSKRAYKKRIKDKKIERSNKEMLHIAPKPYDILQTKEFLSITEVAALTGVSIRTVQRLIERGSLKAAKLGSRTIIRKKQLEKLFQ